MTWRCKATFEHAPNPNSVALISEDGQYTYAQMQQEAKRIAGSIPPRSLVLFVADNTPASICAYVGFLSSRTVPIMVKHDIDNTLLDNLIENYTPSYIWCTSDFNYAGTRVASAIGHALYATGLDTPELNSELALLLTTSGSTGSQKYVRLSYGNVESNARSIMEYLAIVPDDRAITTLPFSYSYGISIVNSHLLAGAGLVLTDRSLVDRGFWDLLERSAVTTFGGVPYTYQMLKRLHFDRMDIPSLRYLTQAGGHLSVDLQEWFGTVCGGRGIEFVIMYGQTEATARLSYLPAEHVLDKVGSIGIAIPDGSFALIDAEGQEILDTDVAGELFYCGPNVSLGYAMCAADLSKGDEHNGRLATGDIAKRDSDGFYYIVGRKKRFLKIFGNRVNLDELEALLACDGTAAACVGKDDSMVVFVENGDKNIVSKLLVEHTGLYKGAFRVQAIEKLPRNGAGKVLYSALEELC